MPGDFDRRDIDARERDEGIRNREEQWLALGRQGLIHRVPLNERDRAVTLTRVSPLLVPWVDTGHG